MFTSWRAVCAVFVVVSAVFVGSAVVVAGPPQENLGLYVALAALNTVPLLAIRRNPLVVVAILVIAYPLWVVLDQGTATLQSLPTLVAIYAVGAWHRPLWLRATALLAPLWMMGAAVARLWDVGLVELGYVAVALVVVWLLGVVVAGRQAYATELEAKTELLQAARRELADRAVADERSRIARELHDVIAHAMSVITVQAGVGAHLSDRGSGPAAKALRIIEQTGREALSEMRRMLRVLRDPDPAGPRPDPQPGLADLPNLVCQIRSAGVRVTVQTHGRPFDVPPGLDLAAYRVVQEALTNVAKHAPASVAGVVIRYEPDNLEVGIRNPAHGAGPIQPGQGLRGMAERVALYDGTLKTGVEEGVFSVTARFPRQTEP